MAVAAISDLALGKFLQISFSEGIRSTISRSFRDWDYVKQQRKGEFDGREVRFMLQTSNGPAAIQYRGTSQAAFPASQKIGVGEYTAYAKEIDATIEIEYNLWNRARKSPSKYGEPLAREIQSKTVAAKRRLAADMYGDGTGVIATCSSASDTTGAGGYTVVTLSSSDSARGHVGFCEFGDLLLNKNAAGTADNPTTSGTFYAWRVKAKSRKNNTVTLEAVNSDGTVLDLTASSIDSGDLLYRIGQSTIADLSGSVSADYGTLTEVWPGLETLISSDGRLVWGITMSGAVAGTTLDCDGNPIDVSYLQEGMDNVKIAVGEDEYSWSMLVGSPEAHAAFIESRESDRRFQSVEDNKRGVKKFAYVHGNDVLEMYTSEFCPKKRMYALPKAKDAEGSVLEYWGSDFETVKANDSGAFHLKPHADGGHQRVISTYLEAYACMICKVPPAVLKLHNFTV
jgi:hypothetical protein